MHFIRLWLCRIASFVSTKYNNTNQLYTRRLFIIIIIIDVENYGEASTIEL